MLVLAAVAVLAGVGVGALLLTRAASPLDVVREWVAARNDHDIETAMSMLADEGEILGFGIHLPEHRERLRSALEAQMRAGWRIDEDECTVDAETVTCRYRQDDEILRRWGLALTGEHRYVVREGTIGQVRRIHDTASQREVYAEAEEFRAWIRAEHPELFDVIWADPTTALYSTPEGVQAILEVLDEYQP